MAGLALYLSPFKLPGMASAILSYMAALNTPLSMLVIGIILAETGRKVPAGNRGLYAVCARRLILAPLLLMCIFKAAVLLHIIPDIKSLLTIIMIAAGTPSAIGVSMLSVLFHKDTVYAGKIVAVTTVLSIITIPLITMLANFIF